MFLESILFFAVFLPALNSGLVVNDMVDQAISGLTPIIRAQGLADLSVDDIRQDWSYRWHFVKLTGIIECTKGHVKDLSTLQRTGDATMTSEGNRLTVNFALGLSSLKVEYRCRVKAQHLLSFAQTIQVHVKTNSVRGQITLIKNGDQCTTNLDSLQVEYINDIKVHSGGGQFHKIEDHFLRGLANHLRGGILQKASSQLRLLAGQHLGKENWCQRLPRLAEY